MRGRLSGVEITRYATFPSGKVVMRHQNDGAGAQMDIGDPLVRDPDPHAMDGGEPNMDVYTIRTLTLVNIAEYTQFHQSMLTC